MHIHQNFSLKPYNTFGLNVMAKEFASFKTIEELDELLTYKKNNETLILGGGSNILFTKNFDGLVLKNDLNGIEFIKEDEEHIFVQASAGVPWHNFVLHCINNNWAGIENLSLIPGSVGASPMQNIGAYGVEIKDFFYSLTAYHIQENKTYTFNKPECDFGYRESIFKRKLKNQFIITDVTFQLKKKPTFNISYGAIEQELEKMQIKQISIKAISDAVIQIRSSKLPNPKEIGNAGSFFKNPEISTEKYLLLKSKFTEIVSYPLPNTNVKLAAGWLIEQCGFKGYRIGDAGCHAKQALVLVNYGNATGQEIYNLSSKIIESVHQKFDVLLEREVNIV